LQQVDQSGKNKDRKLYGIMPEIAYQRVIKKYGYTCLVEPVFYKGNSQTPGEQNGQDKNIGGHQGVEPGFVQIATAIKTKGNKKQGAFNLDVFQAGRKIAGINKSGYLQ
jgi:hypothetical protein